MTPEDLQQMRVILVHNFLTPYRLPLFRELARRVDFHVWILGDVRGIREWQTQAEGFNCEFLPHRSFSLGSRDFRFLLNPGLSQKLAAAAPDLLICTGWDSLAAFKVARWARRNGVPYVLWSGSTANEPNWRRSLGRRAVTRLICHADACLAYGTRAEAYLKNAGADPDRVFCAFNTVATDEFARGSTLDTARRQEIREEMELNTPYVVLFCGQLIARKGVDELMQAFLRLERSDITLVFAGSGGQEARLREIAAPLRDRVRFPGFVPREKLPELYAMADLLVLPSRQEVWGLVINEALACGVPVLTTDVVGAAPDLVVHGKNGYIVPAKNVQSLTDAIEQHFNGQCDRDAMKRGAREAIQPFTIGAAADVFQKAMVCALEHKRP